MAPWWSVLLTFGLAGFTRADHRQPNLLPQSQIYHPATNNN
jgi:hypothetical protein